VSRVQLTVVDHPIARARLSRMRDERTDNANFRAALRDLTQMLMYEATRDLQLVEEPINTPVTATTGYRVAAPPLIVPVLRAGLGMADTAHRLLPESQMGFVGLARNEDTFQPEPYMASLPESLIGREVFVLDPMLATGGTLREAIKFLFRRGASDVTCICLLGAPEGLAKLEEELADANVTIVLASIDEKLNEKSYIVPGLGDAGDRLYGVAG
jgi:uracil phosphoribosyltransferase